jgi:Domain of unknown function (DUF6933)
MLVLRGTTKVLDRLPAIDLAGEADRSTTRLGDWYVNVLFWKSQVALFVSETTLPPVLIPVRPGCDAARSVPPRLGGRPPGPRGTS